MDNSIPQGFRDGDYRLRRFRNWMILGLLYSFFYMSRYNLSSVTDTLRHVFGWDNIQIGVFASVMPLVYGISVVVNGPIADRIGGKKAFLFGASGVVVMNFLYGFAHTFMLHPAVWAGGKLIHPAVFAHGMTSGAMLTSMAIVWGLNGYFQSFGALSIVKVNAQWFHIRERGTFAAIFGILIRLGLILAFSGTPLIVKYLPWYWAFWIPAGFVFLLLVLNFLFVKDTPEKAGYPGLDTGDEAGDDTEERASLVEIIKKVFASRTMWTIALASMMIGFVRRSVVDDWFPLYFAQVYHLKGAGVVRQVVAWGIALMGIIGGFAFGISSDRIYNGRRAPVVVIGFLGMAGTLVLFYLSDMFHLGPWSAVILLSVLSLFVNGAHGMIGGAASMDFGGRKAAASAAGLFDGMQYIAGAFVGIAVGWITQNWGWQAWKLWPIPFALIGAGLMATLWNALPKGRK